MPRRKKSELVPREMYEEMRALYDRLLTKYEALKVQGAVAPEAAVAPQEPALPNPAMQAALQKAQGNPRLLAHYVGFIAGEQARGTHLNDIAAMIEVGQPDDLATQSLAGF